MPSPKEGEVTLVGSGLPAVIETRKDKLEDDLDASRHAIREALEIGVEALKDMSKLADAAQNPAMYGALAEFMSSIGETAERLVELHVRKATSRKISGEKTEEKSEGSSYTQHNIFVGSTEDLQKHLGQIKKL